MANNLGEICIRGAPQGMWEDKVQQYAFGIGNGMGLETLSIVDRFGEIDVRYRVCRQCCCELQRGGWEVRAKIFVVGTKGESGTKTCGKFMGEERIGFTEKADVLV